MAADLPSRAFPQERIDMEFDYPAKVIALQTRLRAFMDEQVYPNERRFDEEVAEGDRWQPLRLIEELKAKARSAGLWNLFLPASARGAGLSNTSTHRCARSWDAFSGRRRFSIARRRTQATWRRSSATPPRSRRSAGSIRSSKAGFAPRSP
jgi:hypothetical protein